MADLAYRGVVVACKAGFRALDFRFDISGTENIPTTGGALLAVNHVSYIDFILAGYAAQPVKRLVRFMAKQETFDHKVSGPIMRALRHIPVDRAEGQGSYRTAVDYLRNGELVGIFPEATISRSFLIKDLKSGAVRMAAEAGVPVLPVILWGTQRIKTKDHPQDFSRGKTISITVGAPLQPTGADPEAETALLHAAMSELLEQAIARYPAEEQPPGAWWLPASHGGSAPTPEEAKRLDAEELAARAARRAAREADKSL